MDIEKEIFELYDNIKLVQNKINELRGTNKELFTEYTKELFKLKQKMQKLEKEVYLYRQPDFENEEIDLYIKNLHDTVEEKPDKYYYFITKHKNKEVIGELELRFTLLESEKYLGNIGAEIKEEYKGKRYAKKAFNLARDILLEKGITKPIFTVKENNIPSIKSLDTIGATRIGSIKNEDDLYYIYEYDLLKDGNIKK